MRIYFIFIFLLTFKTSAQEVYESDLYEFMINKNNFELYLKYNPEEFLLPQSSSFCRLIAKGIIKKEEKFFYQLYSLNENESFKTELLKSEYDIELKDSIDIRVKIFNFRMIDYQNFIYDSVYQINMRELDDSIELSFNIPKYSATQRVQLLAYPRNENFLLSNDAIGLSFSNRLIVSLFDFDLSLLKNKYNKFYFEVRDFNRCNLYLKNFDGDFVKIKDDKLYWKNMIFLKKR